VGGGGTFFPFDPLWGWIPPGVFCARLNAKLVLFVS
jgi:hypothetical protein